MRCALMLLQWDEETKAYRVEWTSLLVMPEPALLLYFALSSMQFVPSADPIDLVKQQHPQN